MSSKSRRKSGSKASKRVRRDAGIEPAGPLGATGAATPVTTHGASRTGPDAEADDDELIHVPKGRNRLQFVFLIFLLVFLLVVFLVPGPIIALFSTGEDPVVVRFENPDGGTTELTANEWRRELRDFQNLLSIGPLQIHAFVLGVEGGRLDSNSMARLLVLERLAEEAGIVVSDEALADYLVTSVTGGTPEGRDAWRMAAMQAGGVARMEETLRRVLRIRRFVDTLAQAARVPDPERIEELWAEEHVEVAYDYVELPVEDLVDEAREQVPPDEELRAWLEELPEARKSVFRVPPRVRATVAWVDPAADDAGGLLEAYPPREEEPAEDGGEDAEPAPADDAQARASEYYDRVFFTRFPRPPQDDPEAGDAEEASDEAEAAGDADAADGEGDPPAEGDEQPAEDAEPAQEQPEPPPSPYLSFEEVEEVAAREAEVYFAMERWLADLRARREAGEEIDLAAEAEALGLPATSFDAPRDREAIAEAEGYGGAFLASSLMRTAEGALTSTPVAEAALVVGQVHERLEASVPEFEEIRDQVADAWAEEHAAELAVARLEELRSGFPAFEPETDETDETDEEADDADPDAAASEDDDEAPADRRAADEDAFRAAAEALGLEVRRRPWLDRAGRPSDDPDATNPAHQHIAQAPELRELEPGEVGPAALGRRGDRAYLVRLVGERDMPLERMTPDVYQQYRQRTAAESSLALLEYLTGEELEARYAVEFPARDVVSSARDRDAFDEELDALDEEAEGAEAPAAAEGADAE